MTNVTLAIEDDIVKKVRKLAVEKNTTLTALVRENLKQLAAREDHRISEQLDELRRCYAEASSRNEGKVGAKTWTREDLHER